MKCSRCEARNSPAAQRCHLCEAPLREGEEEALRAPVPPKRGRLGAAGGVGLAALLLLGAARGGDWLGQRFLNSAAQRPLDERALLLSLHERWKQAHALPVEDLLALHAPHARIVFFGGTPRPLSYLASIASAVRQNGTYNSVTDVVPPQVAIQGSRATITARHRYGHTKTQFPAMTGDRVLVWEKAGGRWLIVEDRYTPTSTMPTNSTPGRSAGTALPLSPLR